MIKFYPKYTEDKNGFSLIELLVVMAIIAVLATIGINSFVKAQRSSRDAKRQADLKVIQSALEQYRSDQNYYPASITPGEPLSGPSKTYLPEIPSDPSGTNYFYQALPVSPAVCNNTSPNFCTSYALCASVENSANENTLTSCDSETYNYEVNAP